MANDLRRLPRWFVAVKLVAQDANDLLAEPSYADALDLAETFPPFLRPVIWIAAIHGLADRISSMFDVGDMAQSMDWLPDEAKEQMRAEFGGHFSLTEFIPEITDALRKCGLVVQAQALAELPDARARGDQSAIEALNAAFGGERALRAGLDAHIEGSAQLRAWVDDHRSEIDDSERLWHLVVRLHNLSAAERNALPHPYHLALAVNNFDAETFNGGVHQFFFNSGGDFAEDAAEALDKIDLPKHAQALRLGIGMFDRPYPAETGVRRAQMQSRPQEWHDALQALGGHFDVMEIEPALIDYLNHEKLLLR